MLSFEEFVGKGVFVYNVVNYIQYKVYYRLRVGQFEIY